MSKRTETINFTNHIVLIINVFRLFIFLLQKLKWVLDPSSAFSIIGLIFLFFFLFSFFFFLFLLLGHFPHVHLIALLTSNRQSNNQRNKLLKVHLAVAVGVQVFHDCVHGCGVLLRLIVRERARRAEK